MGYSGFLLLLLLLASPESTLTERPGDGCGHMVMHQESGTLTSMNYPGTYPNYTFCERRIQVPEGKKLLIKFGDVDIESQDCESSYLKIFSGSSKLEYAHCGTETATPKEMLLDVNEAIVRFESGSHISGRGFLLNYASSEHPDVITCLERASHYFKTEYSKFCPAGCRDIVGDVSGDAADGYRDTSVLCRAAIHAGVIADELGGQIHVIQHKGASHYEAVLANGILSQDGSLSDRRFTFTSTDCSKPLIVESSLTPGEQVTASSFWTWTSETFQWHPEQALLQNEGPSWASNHSSNREWLQIDLGEKRRITGIITRGSMHPDFNFYVKTYVISFKKEGSRWKTYKGPLSKEEKIFKGNSNYLDTSQNTFFPPLVARYVQIVPQTWHQRIALKVELLGCQMTQVYNSSNHPSWQKKNQSMGILIVNEDRTITEVIPSEKSDLGLHLVAIVAPVVVVLCLLLAGIGICATVRKRKTKGDPYSATDNQKTGCWQKINPPFVRHQSTEFTICYNKENESPQKLYLTACNEADYQLPLMIGTNTVTRKGSTFKPVDTETKDQICSAEIESHYACPQRGSRHEYALPLTTQEPEYATPIIERHQIQENTCSSEAGYNVPAISAAFQHLLSCPDQAESSTSDPGGVGYQTPHGLKSAEESDYDKPKVNSSNIATQGSRSNYHRPQVGSLVNSGYLAPRDCLKPINWKTAVAEVL
ncbi:discoidin, CUB and LCCL domain-containing protein 1 [Microcaecilia unicolor]|uniref:Discoidin, CUB and LCCL domain-containing protein 1 n=1 Tax=Microcaecilia unicolor TaxID=1415580 RepID=A0A6P7XV97_9AMPH|nr:discoidin, CUB and LCCL domain-containing protein 1 [Microcaecilia unicolor]